MTLGEKIQSYRKEKGMSQEQFAELFHVSRQAVSKWELNQMIPDIEKIIDIADYFEITVDELIREKELISITKSNNGSVEQIYRASNKKNEIKSNNKFSLFKFFKLGSFSKKVTSIYMMIITLFIIVEFMIYQATFTITDPSKNYILTLLKLNHDIGVPLLIILIVRGIGEITFKLIDRR